MVAKLDLTGVRFGRLTCIESKSLPQSNGTVRVFWECLCDCGNTVLVHRGNLRNGCTKSCGCLKIEMSKTIPTTHGMCGSPEYRSWMACKTRCNNPKSAHYNNYGGRGIRVCQDWVDSFENFYSDMGPKPSNEHTLERVDVNGDYCKDNCIWTDDWSLQTFNQTIRSTNKSGRTGVYEVKPGVFDVHIKGKRIFRTSDFELACFIREEAELTHYGFIKE